jgi:hypothetical protein
LLHVEPIDAWLRIPQPARCFTTINAIHHQPHSRIMERTDGLKSTICTGPNPTAVSEFS